MRLIGKAAMTAAQRQKRRRDSLRALGTAPPPSKPLNEQSNSVTSTDHVAERLVLDAEAIVDASSMVSQRRRQASSQRRCSDGLGYGRPVLG